MSEIEDDIDVISSKVEELKKRMINRSLEEIEKLRQQIISAAEEEAKRIIDSATTEAEAESVVLTKESEENLAKIRKNFDSLPMAVDNIVKMIIKGSVSPISGEPGEDIPNQVKQTP